MLFHHILYLYNYSSAFRLIFIWASILFFNFHIAYCGPEVSTLNQATEPEIAYGLLCDLRTTVQMYHQDVLLYYPGDLGFSITLEEIGRVIATGQNSPSFSTLLNGDLRRICLLTGNSMDVYVGRLDNGTSFADRMTRGAGISMDSNQTTRMNTLNRHADFHALIREMLSKRSTAQLIMREATLCIDSEFLESRTLEFSDNTALYEERVVDHQMRRLTAQLEANRLTEK